MTPFADTAKACYERATRVQEQIEEVEGRSVMVLRKVFESIQVGSVEVPNRIVRTAHGTALGSPIPVLRGEDFVQYHLERAKGGVGLSILEASAVHTSSFALAISDDRVVEGYRELMAAVRPHRMRVFQQLHHQGHIGPASDGGVPWGVSTVPGPLGGVVALPARAEQIEELIDGYAAAARRCRDGGLDGVELHAGHGYLVHQFLSPLYNTRTDEYGGSLENRMRFAQDALRAIRAAVGEDFVVGIRLSASEMPGSIGVQELRTLIETLEGEGLVDFVDASFGDYYRTISEIAGMESPVGYELGSSALLAAAASVPTIVTGRFRTLEEVEQVLVDGVADMVSMVRAHIADPDIVRKTREGRAHEVRPCIACNEGCIGGLFLPPPRLGCAVNPAAGFEATLSESLIVPVAEPRRVLVVGGGPAGLEAARVAALCGHDVTLAEASSALGGALGAARRGPRSAIIGDIVDWLQGAVQRAGVKVMLETRVSVEDVRREGPETVIVATGARPRLDGLQPARPFEPARGVELPHVLSSAQLLTGGLPAGAMTALVLDTTDNFEAITAAEHLVDQGLAVTFLTSHPSFGGPHVQSTCRDVAALEFLYDGEFTLLTRHHLVEIAPSHCLVRPLQGRRTHQVPADVVVLVTPNEPERRLYDELIAEPHIEAVLIGDAVSPRNLQVAMAEGHRTARALGPRTLIETV